ncbi:MAG: glycerate kinase [Actinophytocola sp.]|uniref:glycerate kinase n=1 Tax=Actinophytocola sp. TaxID=1872138 RepID=UPI003C750B62
MRVLICPDKFAGTLTARRAARAIASGWRRTAPADDLVLRPLADGGPGFLDVIHPVVGGERVTVRACDPLLRPVRAQLLVTGDTVYVESAQTCGLHLLSPAELNPMRVSSYGLGVLLGEAVALGAREVVVGLGGSATVDCGAGMLTALGAVAMDAGGVPLPPGGGPLQDCAAVKSLPDLGSVSLTAAADVAIPLLGPSGAARVFGPQKGASPRAVRALERALATFAGHLTGTAPRCPADLVTIPGSGASGGLAAAIMALGGRCVSGAELVWATMGLDDELPGFDLVVTGEGRVDTQTLRGKLPAVVAGAAAARGVPCLVLGGQVSDDLPVAEWAGVSAHSVAELVGSVAEAMSEPFTGLAALAALLSGSRPSASGSARTGSRSR